MKLSKRLGALFVALCLMLTMIPAVAAANTTGAITLTIGSPTMSVNGSSTAIDAQGSRATLYKNSTMLPIRGVVENMGGTADWNSSTKQVTLKFNGSTVVLTLGSTTAYVNGVKKTMQVAPFTDNGRTYVWLRTVEFFPNVTVNWRADTRQATVVYPMIAGSTVGGTKVSMTLKNGADLIFKSMQLAPAGTTNWGTNILTQNLNWNGTQTVSVNVGKAVYDLMATDYYGNKFYYRNLDFTSVQNIAVLTLTGGDTFSLVVDGILASGADKKINLNVYNATGQQITSMVYGPANAGVWSNELLTTYRFNNGTGINLNLDYSSTSPYYDFRVTYASGIQYVFKSVNLNSQFGTQLIRLNSNGLVTYNNSTTGTSSGEADITFRNRSGETVYELKMSTSSSASTFKGADNLISKTKNGSEDDFDFDLSGVRKWYIRAYDDDGDTIASGSITFSSTNIKSATITLNKSGDFSVSGNKSDSDGDVTAVISNTSGQDIDAIFAIDPSDDDWDDDDWDYSDFEDEYEDLGSLDDGEYDTFDLDLYGSNDNKVDLVLFYNGADDDDDDFDVISITFDKDVSDYAVIRVTDYSSGDFKVSTYDDGDELEDEGIVVEILNQGSSTLEKIYVRDSDDGDEDDDSVSDFDDDTVWSGSLSKGDSDYLEIDNDDWGDDGECDLLLVFSNGDNIVIESVDTTDYDYFMQIVADGSSSDVDGE